MILSALNDYYQRLLEDKESGIAPPGYSQEKIGFAVVLAADGTVVDVLDVRDQSGRKPLARVMSVPQPEKRTVAVKSNFLWDKTSYALGVSATSKRSAQEHDAFKTLHHQLLVGNEDPGLKALLAFLGSWSPADIEGSPHFARHGEALLDANLVFRLDGEPRYLHERPAARTVWASMQGNMGDAGDGLCLVTGVRGPIARLHPAIKGVNGAQSSGASIVSFNLDAFQSYGKEQGANAPVSEQAAFAYTTTLNHLLRRDDRNRQRMQIGDTTVVFWAQAPIAEQAAAAESFMAAMFSPQQTDAQATARLQSALDQVRKALPLGQLPGHLDDGTRIFVLGLAPNASRLSIRFWETSTLGEFARHMAEHYDDMALQPPAWRQLPTPWLLALQTAPIYGEGGKAKSEDVPPLLAGELTRAILSGSRYPRSVLSAIVMRLRADGQITPLRAALCKAVLARDARLAQQQGMSSIKGVPPVSLDPGNTDPGYLLGRLFSTLENTQRAALGAQVNATIRDRYYGAASSTPASVFPVLLRNAQNHLGKLRKDKPGFAVVLEKEIGQTIDLLGASFPRSLKIEAQGRFAIGYYHQTQARFAGKDGQDGQDANSTEIQGEAA